MYLDWLRGLAVLFMILWHVVDSWTLPDARRGALFRAVVFMGGAAAPLFLFLAGVSVPLAASSRVGRGCSRSEASWALQKRGWQVFGLAHLFRLQSFLLNPAGSWNSLFKPDILNILGLGIVVTAWLWGRASESKRSQVAWLIVPTAIVIFVLSPLAPTWWWPSLLHPRLEAYVRRIDNNGVFSLFPATAYVLAGGFVGTRLASARERMGRYHLSLAGTGAVSLAVAWVLSDPQLHRYALWVDFPAAVLGRLGGMLVLMAYTWWMFRAWPAFHFSRVALLGQTSLFVYWIHVELAYGTFSFAVRQRLPLGWSLVGYALMCLAMYGLAVRWSRRSRGPLVPAHMVARAAPSFSYASKTSLPSPGP